MSYYHPGNFDHPSDVGQRSPFSIASLKFVVKELKEPLFIFDLPTNLVVCLDNVEIPSHVFDYLNPLVVDPDGLGVSPSSSSPRHGQLLFYWQGEDEPVEVFSCLQLIPMQAHVIIPVLDSTIHYPPNFDIDYRTLTVSRTLRTRQLCELFEKIQPSPAQPMVPPFPFQRGMSNLLPQPPDSEHSLGRLLSVMFRPLATNPDQTDEAPPSPSPVIFLDPETETFMIYQADDSDQNEEDDSDDEEIDDDLD